MDALLEVKGIGKALNDELAQRPHGANVLIERIVAYQGLLSQNDLLLDIKTMIDRCRRHYRPVIVLKLVALAAFLCIFVRLDGKFVPHFKPGKELRDR